MARNGHVANLTSRFTTVGQILTYFSSGRRIFLLPILIIILLSALLLVLAGGISYITPFVYVIF
jgi:Family of unknown function (DUF5989)